MTSTSRAAYIPIDTADRDKLSRFAALARISKKEAMHRLINSPRASECFHEVDGDDVAYLPVELVDHLNGLAGVYGFSVDTLIHQMHAAYAAKIAEDAKLRDAYIAYGRAEAQAERTLR